MNHNYEPFEIGDSLYEVSAVTSANYRGASIYPFGWETEPDEDTDWTGIEIRTGRVLCVMVGDDRIFSQDEGDLTPLARESYCGECGQVGCTCDGYDRE